MKIFKNPKIIFAVTAAVLAIALSLAYTIKTGGFNGLEINNKTIFIAVWLLIQVFAIAVIARFFIKLFKQNRPSREEFLKYCEQFEKEQQSKMKK